MSNSKRVVIIMLCILVTCSFLVRDTEGTNIGYGAIDQGDPIPCGPLFPEACKEIPANTYQRGCNPETGCQRETSPALNKEIVPLKKE
ncbi:hypothetical protein Pint_22106 [Pistacia integerrima]|uniref:Uncharacterized protein n=1 Tax=Pistacia integerrima TaxID=434235 RepID=A0ACC0YQ09_9ROSI|nr:hypothetical protein Pint_22106 [Pistacia integerrima]